MNFFILLISKIALFILTKIGKGSSFPGALALKMNKHILKFFKLPDKVIFITGTNGKSTIANVLSQIYSEAGFKVTHNFKGSNLERGVTSALIQNSNLFGKIKSDVVILEVDERYVKVVLNYIKPNYFIINNISRDQPPRQGHFDFVFNEISQNIDDEIHLILNADDPMITKFSLNHKGKITYYGFDKTDNSLLLKDLTYDDNLDMLYCPICDNKLNFNYIHRGNIGDYHCPNNDFNRPNPEFLAQIIDDDNFKINNSIIKFEKELMYNIYNLTACYSLAILDNINIDTITQSLNNIHFKRLEKINKNNITYHMISSKNENAVSYNQSLDYINNLDEDLVVFIGFDYVSKRYSYKDLSWFWDIKFEKLNKDNIKSFILVGNFRYDIATRLSNANISIERIKIANNFDEASNELNNLTTNNVTAIVYDNIESLLRNYLRR